MICRYIKEVPEMAVQLVEVNDKPMTIIYPGAITGPSPAVIPAAELPKPDRNALAFNTVAEDGTVGIRIPMMDFCQQLISRFGRPIVSTSANISGEPTPKNYSEISDEIRTRYLWCTTIEMIHSSASPEQKRTIDPIAALPITSIAVAAIKQNVTRM